MSSMLDKRLALSSSHNPQENRQNHSKHETPQPCSLPPSHAHYRHNSISKAPPKTIKTPIQTTTPTQTTTSHSIQSPNMSSIVQQYHDAEDKGNQAWLRQDYRSAKTYYQKS